MIKRSILFMGSTLTRSLAILFALSLLWACVPKNESRPVPNSTSKRSKSVFKGITNQAAAPNESLTEESVMDFLLLYGKEHANNQVIIHTEFGEIGIRLYQNTPLHRANFLYLTARKYFDGTWFYRVSPGHVIQAGNNDDGETGKKRTAIGDYKIPNEISAGNLHVRGAVAAARSYYQNPDKKSNPYEFYIVLGKKYTQRQLELLSDKEGFALTEKQISTYAEQAGSPHLDAEHTVFGMVTSGMEVVDAISKVKTDAGEWPLENVVIKVEVVK